MNVNITLKDHLHDEQVILSNTNDRNKVCIEIKLPVGEPIAIVLEADQLKLALRKLSAR